MPDPVNAIRTHARRIPRNFLNGVERVGNRLPHPFILFLLIAAAIAVASLIASLAGATVIDPKENTPVAIQSLISGEGLQFALTSMIDNFLSFPPLGLVIVMLLGVGLANQVGLLEVAFKAIVARASSRMLTFVVIFVGIVSNVASESAAIVIPPLAAMLFLAVGRHPIAGLAAGFGAVGAGFSANFLIAGTDVLLSGLTTSAAGIVDSDAVVTPVANWYFMSASTVVLTLVGVFVTERIVEPRLGPYERSGQVETGEFTISVEQRRGLRRASLAAMVYLVAAGALIVPPKGLLRGDDGGIIDSPFMDSLVPIIFLFFVTVGVVYGAATGAVRSSSDVPKLMIESARELAGILVLVFAVAQALAYFEWTNIGLWIAVQGAEVLDNLELHGVVALVILSIVTLVLSLVISSGSALWSIMAPVFVPMMMLNDVNPAYAQLAYRIADSSTNMLVPLSPILAVALGYIQRYDKKAGIGTVFALMIPYAIAFYAIWIVLFVVWVLLGVPIGPGQTLHEIS
ncbi:AbgT family transporter [Nocardia carnea]|uniref:AbgT family transporter n=1 Tax=Nocardia carnea TaxID=37328 RepID=UPI0024562F55|nr:AbgT family transporter [Nocardia carnea]